MWSCKIYAETKGKRCITLLNRYLILANIILYFELWSFSVCTDCYSDKMIANFNKYIPVAYVSCAMLPWLMCVVF